MSAGYFILFEKPLKLVVLYAFFTSSNDKYSLTAFVHSEIGRCAPRTIISKVPITTVPL